MTFTAGSPGDGSRIDELPGFTEGSWVSMVLRDGRLLPHAAGPACKPATKILLLIDPEQDTRQVTSLFTKTDIHTAS